MLILTSVVKQKYYYVFIYWLLGNIKSRWILIHLILIASTAYFVYQQIMAHNLFVWRLHSMQDTKVHRALMYSIFIIICSYRKKVWIPWKQRENINDLVHLSFITFCRIESYFRKMESLGERKGEAICNNCNYPPRNLLVLTVCALHAIFHMSFICCFTT